MTAPQAASMKTGTPVFRLASAESDFWGRYTNLVRNNSSDEPYPLTSAAAADEAVELVAVPYQQWGNRGSGEVGVWVRR